MQYTTLNRSFARRIGKHLSASQSEFLTNILPLHLVDPQQPISLNFPGKVYLEIGFGMGEHLINQIKSNPDDYYIGCEPYLNGVANLLKLATAAQVSNYSIWPDDVDMILDNIAPNSLDGVYILFPDPWPKARQKKRRLVNRERLVVLHDKLKINAKLYFASDIYDYITQIQNIITDLNFTQSNIDILTPHFGYATTKYHAKARENNIVPKFLQFTKHA